MKMRTVISLLLVLSIVSILTPLTSSAQDSPVYMYWTHIGAGKIQRANLNGSNVEDLVTENFPISITLDMSGGKMYWTAITADNRHVIRRANLDGTNVETLFIGGVSKEGLALDTSGGKIYWSEGQVGRPVGEQKIRRANLDGSNVEDLITGFFPGTNIHIGPRGIALDLSRGKMYWTDTGAGKIQRANLDGSNIEDLITILDAPHQISLDFNSGKIYWTDWDAGKIQRANFDGSHIEDLVIGLSNPAGIALDSPNDMMYWVERGGGKIRRANLDGTNVEDLVTGMRHPFGITLGISPTGGLRFDPNVIEDQTFTVGTAVDLTLPIAIGGTRSVIYTLVPSLPAGLSFGPGHIGGTPTAPLPPTPFTYTATDATGASASLTFTITVQDTPSLTDVYMYWVDVVENKIQRANLDGTNVQDIATGFGRPVSIAVDIASGKMYWTDRDRNDLTDQAGRSSIHRANLNGTNVETLIIGGPSVKEAIALDPVEGKVYWVDWLDGSDDKIYRANLDGTNVEDVITGLANPRGLALDLSRGKMYWTNNGGLQRANLDGSNLEDILPVDHAVYHLALDFNASKIYWTSWTTIHRANLDGSNLEDLVDGLERPFGVALDSLNGKMYWTDWVERKIQRANLDGSNIEDLITTGLNGPVGLALGIPQPSGGLRFDPNVIADQMFTVGTAVNLTLPTTMGGTPPYTYTLAPTLPAGLSFDPIANGHGYISGTPTATLLPTPFTYTATDARGAAASLTFTITVEDNLDVNGDGQVDVLDLVWVAVSYGMRGTALPADVNADGIVNIQDLVAVAAGIDAGAVLPTKIAEEVLLAAALDGAAGAPAIGFNAHPQGLSGLTAYGNVAAALSDARSFVTGDVRFGKWLPLLEELLHLLAEMGAIPDQTALLPNYPNPFNPETWIPYHLAQDTAVVLTIYDVRGRVVRELTLGHQSAGVYESRGRAAYWDGRNQLGEPVASGLYFYTLTAGEFNATRKLLIAK